MKEIDINIEGFNVNGICVGCLNYKRKMYYDNDIKDCFRLLCDIDVPDGLSIQVCWECLASVKAVGRFQTQILKSYEVLIAYSQQHMFLNSPTDLTKHASTHLTMSPVITEVLGITNDEKNDEKVEVKVECGVDDGLDDRMSDGFEEESFVTPVKNEMEFGYDNYEPEQNDSSEDEVLLSKIKKKKEKKSKKKEKRLQSTQEENRKVHPFRLKEPVRVEMIELYKQKVSISDISRTLGITCKVRHPKYHLQESDKIRIIELHAKEMSVSYIAQTLGFTRNTVGLWIRRWKKEGNLMTRTNTNPGRPRKTDKNQDLTILYKAKNECSTVTTLSTTNNVSKTTIYRRLKEGGIRKAKCESDSREKGSVPSSIQH